MSAATRDETYYDLLEISRSATASDIDDAYGRLSTRFGVDAMAMYSVLPEEDLVAMRNDIDEAYRTLSDPERRAVYDGALCRSGEADYPSVVVPRQQDASTLSVGRVASGTMSDAAIASEHASGGSPDDSRETVPDAPRGVGADLGAYLAPGLASDVAGIEEASSELVDDSRGASEAKSSTSQPGAVAERIEEANDSGDLPPGVPARPVLQAETSVRTPAKTAKRFEPPLEMRQLPTEGDLSGSTLRRIRDSCGVTLVELAEITKISRRYLRAIEENDFDTLPAPVYVRGFVRDYARVFGVDQERMATSYLALYRRHKEGS